jgi:hypothetical protein
MTAIKLDNSQLQVVCDPDHGGEITLLAGAHGANLLFAPDWRSPLPAAAGESYGNQQLDWLSEYRGGWQELFPNAGGPGEVMGVPLPFHGEVSRARWSWEWLSTRSHVRMSTPARLPLVLEREMRVDPDHPTLYIQERVRNEAPFAVPYIWAHHPAWGPPLVAPGARIDLPGGLVTADGGMDGPAVDLPPGSAHAWPMATGRAGQSIDLSLIPAAPLQRLCYVHELPAAWYAVRNPEAGLGVAVAWDLAVMPCLWLWQEIGGGQGLPWYGRGAITALEPAVQWPSYGLAQAQQAGTARVIQPGQTHTFNLTCTVLAQAGRTVSAVDVYGNVRFAG